MIYPIKMLFKALFFICLLFNFASTHEVMAQEGTEQVMAVQFVPGQVVQLIAPISDPVKEPLRRAYYQTAIPLAQSYGFKNYGTLVVEQTIVGEFKPPVIVIGGWPSLHAQNEFKSHGDFKDIKLQRANAWEELMIYNHLNPDRTALSFDKDKSYTVAFAWTKLSHPNSYFEYLDAVEPMLAQLGARFMHKMVAPNLDAIEPNSHAPQQITFVEWQSDDDLRKLQSLPEYKKIYPLFLEGIEKFEFHRVSPRIQ